MKSLFYILGFLFFVLLFGFVASAIPASSPSEAKTRRPVEQRVQVTLEESFLMEESEARNELSRRSSVQRHALISVLLLLLSIRKRPVITPYSSPAIKLFFYRSLSGRSPPLFA